MNPDQFINPQEAEAKVAARYRVLLVLWLGIFGSLAFLLVLAVFTPSSGTPNQTLTLVFVGVGVMAVIASLFIKRMLAQRAIQKRDGGQLQSGYVVAFAMSESAALFALLDHFTTGSRYFYLGFVVAVMGMLLNFPNKDHVRGTL